MAKTTFWLELLCQSQFCLKYRHPVTLTKKMYKIMFRLNNLRLIDKCLQNETKTRDYELYLFTEYDRSHTIKTINFL